MYDTYCRLTKKRQTNTNINTTYKTCICLFTQRETTILTSLCRNYLHVRASVFRSHLSLTCAAVTCNKEQVVRRCFCRFIFSVRSNLVISTHVKQPESTMKYSVHSYILNLSMFKYSNLNFNQLGNFPNWVMLCNTVSCLKVCSMSNEQLFSEMQAYTFFTEFHVRSFWYDSDTLMCLLFPRLFILKVENIIYQNWKEVGWDIVQQRFIIY